ncbi:unnamed protein product, partial [Brachionus calyciflorus]
MDTLLFSLLVNDPKKDNRVNKGNNTTNLWRHLENEHPTEHALALEHKEEKVQAKLNFNNENQLSFFGSQLPKSVIDSLIADLITRDLQPFSIVEDTGFQNL